MLAETLKTFRLVILFLTKYNLRFFLNKQKAPSFAGVNVQTSYLYDFIRFHEAATWSYTAQNVINIPAMYISICLLVCPKMPQNEERITFNSGSYKTVHFSHSLHQKLLHFPHLPLLIMASDAQEWVLIPRNLGALDFPGKNKKVRNACKDDFLE